MTNTQKMKLSLVVPMYNEAKVIPHFFSRVRPVLDSLGYDCEIICINDGSSDDTLSRIQAERTTDPRIKILDLSRNFGKELALTAGIDHATGDAVIPIDVDLQDPPEIIPDMVQKWRDGYDVVLAVREDRSTDSFIKRSSANWFYNVMGKLGEVAIPANAGDFRLMDRQVVDSLKLIKERSRFMKGIFAWVGYKTTTVSFSRESRVAGETSWKYWKLWNFALEGIISFSSLPLKIWSYLGVLTSLGALVFMAVVIMRTIIVGVDTPGYASMMAVLLFFFGIILICLGVIGEYLGRIFIEVKQRPLYLVRQTFGLDDTD
ncbi:glycosyltransferase family 2 protein [Pseudodesulfovibrio sp.]|nr:glycosyltransferase family 2 protein [Pseudodesulfovibrio sp.]